MNLYLLVANLRHKTEIKQANLFFYMIITGMHRETALCDGSDEAKAGVDATAKVSAIALAG
ncbi:hypothetical protein [Franconibacter helveticus]|uniref:hypothetical protein n=1 Tax=Franconibacter helveticus TaxID=357240 RepID=UPI000DA22391|nr:hypothetical protein [Franconibacter helveticus]